VLLRLQIENLALIEHAELDPGPGLNVLTGETGAGKTMLAQAIGLVAGGAPGPGLVGPQDGIEPLRRMCKWIISESPLPGVKPIWEMQEGDAALVA